MTQTWIAFLQLLKINVKSLIFLAWCTIKTSVEIKVFVYDSYLVSAWILIFLSFVLSSISYFRFGLMFWHLKILIKCAFIIPFSFFGNIPEKGSDIASDRSKTYPRLVNPHWFFCAITLSFLSLPVWPLGVYCWSIIVVYHRFIASRAGRDIERMFNPFSYPEAEPAVSKSSLTDVCLSCF